MNDVYIKMNYLLVSKSHLADNDGNDGDNIWIVQFNRVPHETLDVKISESYFIIIVVIIMLWEHRFMHEIYICRRSYVVFVGPKKTYPCLKRWRGWAKVNLIYGIIGRRSFPFAMSMEFMLRQHYSFTRGKTWDSDVDGSDIYYIMSMNNAWVN